MLRSINPYTGKPCHEVAGLSDSEIGNVLQESANAFPTWRQIRFQDRAEMLVAVARELRKDKDKLARLMAEEMGKPIKEGRPEVEKGAWCAEFYAENAERFLAREEIPSDASMSYVSYQALGPVVNILPWNAPTWLALRAIAPALMAGNTCLMKHDPHVPATAAAIAECFKNAGVPTGVMANLAIETGQVEAVMRDARVSAISFTGSSAAGAKVAAIAGSEIKPSVLELGGSDPCIIFADAELEKAADIACLSRIINAGQSCIAAKRILVQQSVYQDMLNMLQQRLEALTLGDPLQESTDLGPIARADLRDNLNRQVQQSIDAGARCITGGYLPEADGFLYPATLLADVEPQMPAFSEETFGPVACVTPFKHEADALALANQTQYGLGAAVWTSDSERARFFAEHIVSGQVAVNGIVKTDPRLPSGGVKRSGLGRELGPHGIREFVNAKQIWIA